jgi:hypothetical protein
MGLDHLQYIDLTQGLDHGIARLRHVLPRPQFPYVNRYSGLGSHWSHCYHRGTSSTLVHTGLVNRVSLRPYCTLYR